MLETVKGWWNYSRTIFLNVASLLGLILAQIIAYLVGVDWSAVMGPQAAFYMTMVVNVANIVLRYATTGPVGNKETQAQPLLTVPGEGGPDVTVKVDK